MDLEEIKRTAIPACREFDFKRLDVFGSVARGEDAPSSDLDFLVEFRDPVREPSRRFFGLLHYLEDSFHRRIDLLTTNSLRNPYLRRQILKDRVNVFEG